MDLFLLLDVAGFSLPAPNACRQRQAYAAMKDEGSTIERQPEWDINPDPADAGKKRQII